MTEAGESEVCVGRGGGIELRDGGERRSTAMKAQKSESKMNNTKKKV